LACLNILQSAEIAGRIEHVAVDEAGERKLAEYTFEPVQRIVSVGPDTTAAKRGAVAIAKFLLRLSPQDRRDPVTAGPR